MTYRQAKKPRLQATIAEINLEFLERQARERGLSMSALLDYWLAEKRIESTRNSNTRTEEPLAFDGIHNRSRENRS